MAGECVVETFRKNLPTQNTWTNTALLTGAQPHSTVFGSGRMLGGSQFPRDVPAIGESSARDQKLPPVSHLLGIQNFPDGPSRERTFSTYTPQNASAYPGPYQGYGYYGEQNIPAASELYRRPPQAYSTQPHYRQGSDVTLQSPYSNRSSLAQESSRSMSSSLEKPRIRRVLREEDIPNKGVCYIYDDGTYCPKAVDGDSVNPQWGITKAGKPRKRLAQACTTCREKKIRCDPGTHPSQCSQCMKFRRECRFEQLSRSSQRSPSLASTANSPGLDTISRHSPGFPRDTIPSTEHLYRPGTSSKTSVHSESFPSPPPQRRMTNGHDSDRPDPPKKPRTSSSSSLAAENITSHANSNRDNFDKMKEMADDVPPDILPTWDVDPWEFDSEMTNYYLEEYFTKTNMTTYCMFPRKPFMRWVKECREKSSWDKMLLYAMLAHGSIFATHSRNKADGRVFSRIAHHAIQKSTGEFNLQVVQTRLILALHDFANGSPAKAWDFTGAAVRAACGMRLNVEEGILDIKSDQILDYGFEKAMLIECRRRTFWSAYIMDRFNGFCSGHLAMFHDADCLLRLPCNETMYEKGNIPTTPFFDSEAMDPQKLVQNDPKNLGMMAYLVTMASIWGDVLARACRSRYEPPCSYGRPFAEFYDQTTRRLNSWATSLSDHLKCTPDNIDKAGQGGYLGTYGALHTLYHCTVMKLNRHARYNCLRPEHVARNVRTAHEHAGKTLDMMRSIAKLSNTRNDGRFGFAVDSPFTGFAILTAMDILTATGALADLLDPNSRTQSQLSGGIEVMSELAEHWNSAKNQLKLVADRYGNLLATLQSHGSIARTGTGRTSAFFAREPLESAFGLEHDLAYSTPRKEYLEALGLGSIIRDGDEMLEVQKRGSELNTVALSRPATWR